MKTKELITQSKKNQLLESQLDSLNQHKLNLQNSYQKLTSAKSYKLWQLFNKIKKNPKIIPKAVKIFIEEGPKGIKNKLKAKEEQENTLTSINEQYQIWLQKNWPTKKLLAEQKSTQKSFTYRPKISIITPVYNPDEKWLRLCIESVIKQSYDNWELCLADDCSTKSHVKKVLYEYSKKDNRIKVVYRSENGHISRASNSALKLATGDFIALLDHDDELSPNALFEVVKVLNEDKKIDFIYSDEDKMKLDGKHVDPFFKPDWSPDMFLSTNYICHLTVIRKKIIDAIKGFRVGYEGSQDYDLFLRATELTNAIYHIPKILYSWRKIPGSTSVTYSVKNYANQASINALQDTLKRKHIKGVVENGLVEGSFRTRYKIIGKPLVSIIIPTKDKIKYLKRCINSILKKTTYDNYEIIVIDTGSIEKETRKYYNHLKDNKKITFLNWKGIFNYSSVNNFAVSKAKGKYILLLNNDTEVITPNWIESMIEHAQRREVGAVGAKLLYPDNTIQHAGVIMGIGGVANHASLNLPDNSYQTFPVSNSKDMVRDFSAVTAACLLVSKAKYLSVGGLDEKYRIAFNDIDFCLKLSEKGYLNVYTPFARLYHHESISVGKPQNGTRNIEEFHKEVYIMKNKWKKYIENDPFYNVNLSKRIPSFNIKY